MSLPKPPKKRLEKEGRSPMGMLVQYRGGAECFYEISYAGRRHRVPGWMQLHDAMKLVVEGEL